MFRSHLALAALVALAACNPACPAVDEVSVVGDEATPSQIRTVQSAVQAFSAWTGDGGTCVDTVVLTSDMPEEQAEGMVQRGTATLNLSVDGDLQQRTWHQLCHAMDHAYGLSEEAFSDEEAFASACAEGPKVAEAKAYRVCEDGDVAANYLLQSVFTGTWDQQIVEGRWVMDRSASLFSVEEGAQAVPAGDGAAVLRWSVEDGMARPVLQMLVDAGFVTGPELPLDAGWQVFGGGGEDPILLVRDAGGSTAYRFDVASREVVQASVPASLAVDEGVVAGGALFVSGRVDDVWGAWRVDLSDGSSTPWSTPIVVDRPQASHGRISLPDGDVVHVYDVHSDLWSAWPMPLELLASQAMPDADGGLSVRWTHDGAFGMARLAGPDAAVQIDVEVCADAGAVEGQWMSGTGQATWLAWSAQRSVEGTLSAPVGEWLHVGFE